MDDTCIADDLKEINRFGHQYFEIAQTNIVNYVNKGGFNVWIME